MNRKDLTAKKARWSSDNVVIVRRRPKTKRASFEAAKIIAKPKPKKKSGKTKIPTPTPKQKSQPEPRPKSKKAQIKEMKQFGEGVLIEMNKILPPRPFKIGITKDIFDELKDKYPDKRTKLRKAIKFYMKHKTAGRHYLRALIIGDHRYGLHGEKYTITKEHREHAKINLIAKLKEYEQKKKKK